jgi:hypothetical protein
LRIIPSSNSNLTLSAASRAYWKYLISRTQEEAELAKVLREFCFWLRKAGVSDTADILNYYFIIYDYSFILSIEIS